MQKEINPNKTVKYVSKKKWLWLYFVGILPFVVISFKMKVVKIDWLLMIFCGYACITLIIRFLPNSGYLILSPDGFTISNFYHKRSFCWNEIEYIGASAFGEDNRVKVFFKLYDGYEQTTFFSELKKIFTTPQNVLPDTYGFTAHELALLMNHYKDYNEKIQIELTDIVE